LNVHREPRDGDAPDPAAQVEWLLAAAEQADTPTVLPIAASTPPPG
jgi:hypothetical protein